MFRAPVRPTLLRMAPAAQSSTSPIELEVWITPGRDGRPMAHWLTLWQLVDMLIAGKQPIKPGKDSCCKLDLWQLDQMGGTVFPPRKAVVTSVTGTTRNISLAAARPPRQQAEADTQGELVDDSDSNAGAGSDAGESDHGEGVDSDAQGQSSDLDDIVAAWAELPPPVVAQSNSSTSSSSTCSSRSSSSSSSKADEEEADDDSSLQGSQSAASSNTFWAEADVDTGLQGSHGAAGEVPEVLADQQAALALPGPSGPLPDSLVRARAPRRFLKAGSVTIHHDPGKNAVYIKCKKCGFRMTRTLTSNHIGKGRPLGLLAAWVTVPCLGDPIHRAVVPESGPQRVLWLASAIVHHRKREPHT